MRENRHTYPFTAESCLMDWVAAVASIGTLVVAIVALYSIWITRRELQIIEKQALFQRSEVYPFLELKSKKVVGNSVNLELRNRGKGPAFEIAVRSDYIPLRQTGGGQDFVSSFEAATSEGTGRFDRAACATYLRNAGGRGELYDGEEDAFAGEIRFFGDSKEDNQGLAGKWFAFDELKAALVRNGIQTVAISLSVVWKDVTEDYLEDHPLYTVVAELRKHASLEEAVKDNIPFHGWPVSPDQWDWMPWHMYENSKTRRAFLEDPTKRFRERV